MHKAYVIAGESGDSLGVALLMDVVSEFLVVIGVVGVVGLTLFSAAARTICVGSPEARMFFECRFS
jgi:hypothetical protein